jgi:hypothetical protein
MSKRYQNGCLYREKRKAGPDVWVFRFRGGQTNWKEIIDTGDQFSTKTKALRACELLRANINRGTRAPCTMAELISHYTETELSRKAYSTREVHGSYVPTRVNPYREPIRSRM